MTYTLVYGMALGRRATGTSLTAQLYDTSGGAVGALISGTFFERGNGYYTWLYSSFPDDFRGWADINTTGSYYITLAINPEDAEYLDAKVSTRSTLTQADIINDATPFPGGNIDVTISSRSDFDETTDQVIVATNNDKTGYALSAAGVDAILDEIVEGTLTFRQGLRIVFAVLFGKVTGGGTTNPKFRDLADTKDRVDATVDAQGNRTSISIDGT